MPSEPGRARLIWIPPFLALAWGLNWPAVKLMLSALPPFALRAAGLGAAALLLLATASAKRIALCPPRSAWIGVLISGVLNVALFNICTAFAQLNTSTSRAAVLTYTMPLMSALLAWAFLGERLSVRGRIAWLLGAAGIGLLAWPALSGAGPAAGQRAGIGLALPLLAALGWAAGTVALKRWPLAGDRIVNTAWQLVLGSACAGIGMLAFGEHWPAALTLPVALALAYHVVVATSIAYVLWFKLLDHTSATTSALTTLAVPLVGVIGATALAGERPAALDWPGFALVLGAAALILIQWRGSEAEAALPRNPSKPSRP